MHRFWKALEQGEVLWGRTVCESRAPSSFPSHVLSSFLLSFLTILWNSAQYVRCLILTSVFSEEFQNYDRKARSPNSLWNPFAADWKLCVCVKTFRLCFMQHTEELKSQLNSTGRLLLWVISLCLVRIALFPWLPPTEDNTWTLCLFTLNVNLHKEEALWDLFS